MLNTIKKIIQKSANLCGYKITKVSNSDPVIDNSDPVLDKDERFKRIYDKCRQFTNTSKEKMFSFYQSTKYVINTGIEGDLVECGTLRGGRMMLVAYALLEMGITDRKIYLYDTFKGMPEPTAEDYSVSDNRSVFDKWKRRQRSGYNEWCYATLSEVKDNMALTQYPNVVFVEGKIEETIPRTMPSQIALLGLDTDWYESTKHELIHLFPLLSKSGVLIVDDYEYWAGSKKAVDEYFSGGKILLNRLDGAGRIGIKIE